MKRLLTALLFFTLLSTTAVAELKNTVQIKEQSFRGWGHLVQNLHKNGVPLGTLKRIFNDKRLPPFTELFYAVEPKESKRMYAHFTSSKKISAAQKYMRRHSRYMEKAQAQYDIDPAVIASVILVETHLGSYTGRHRILYRLARLANASSPTNMQRNYKRLRKQDKSITFEQVKQRGLYLERIFTPQVEAAIEIAKKRDIDVFSIKGSSAGAFGIPQFLPGSYLRFAVDGNGDGVISLYQHPDAIMSVSNFLRHYQQNPEGSSPDLRGAIWEYNRSEAYVDAILRVAQKLGFTEKSSKK